MRYFKEFDENGKLIAVGAGDAFDGVEITEEEYLVLEAEIIERALLADKLYHQEIAPDEVPAEWQEDVQAQVNEMIAEFGPYDPDEIGDDEALDIITGVSE